MAKSENEIHGGRFYGRLTRDGPLVPVDEPLGEPDAWICRRVADFPQQQIPEGGLVAACSRCQAPIAFNPIHVSTAPKVCMQCMRIQPLPITGAL